ncbi:hypothetical protein D3C87_1204240 [compost metagenome]
MGGLKENKYCDDEDKVWIINCNGKESKPQFVSAKNASNERFPELNFEDQEKEFIVQFANLSDLVGCRDCGKPFNVHVTNLNRTKRIPATIKHEKIWNQ